MDAIRFNSLWRKTPGILAVLVALVLAFASPAYAANPAPVQTYYVTLPESDALTALSTINADAVAPMYTYFSISIALNDTLIYYDQWEDGYALDIANPTTGPTGEIYSAANVDGVQIWGNGEADDGCAPNIAGVAVTCTDANDVLHRGDVIIPYNSVALPRTSAWQSNVLDNFGTVSYSNNNGNTNWSSDWVETGDNVSPNYRDEFSSQSYSLSAGSITWTTSWTEVGENDGPTAGVVRVDDSPASMRFGRGNQSTPVGRALYRVVNLSGYTGATLSYSYSDSSNEAADAVQVQVRNPPGAWATLATITGTSGTGTGSHDISAYMDSDTEVRFYVSQQLETNDYMYFDNVDVSLTPGGTPSGPAAGDILITGGALRFTATEANDSIERGVSLPTGDTCATLSLTLGRTGIDAGEDQMELQISADGGGTWNTLETYTSATTTGAKSYPITGYATANTRIRFIALDALETTAEYWTFDAVQVTWNCMVPVLFDARDKVGASNPIAMARAVWASGSGTLNAFAHEMYPVAEWGTEYIAPVGTDTANDGTAPDEMFEYAALSIMASQNETLVDVDVDGDGDFDLNDVPLNEGGTVTLSNVDYTLEGARVVADKPVQVVLITGDIGSNYGSRDMNLLPVSTWGSSYWSPVGRYADTYTTSTRLFMYNPSSNGAIYITCERYGTTSTTQAVGAGAVVTIDLTDGQGAHCYASNSGGTAVDAPIFGIGTMDAGNDAYDWSLTLFPDGFLTTDALVGLGLGKDPTNTTSTENGSPIWVTATCNTFIYVDWDNDGDSDPIDVTGDDVADTTNIDADHTYGYAITRLQSLRLFEPGADEEEYDQTGARVWSRTTNDVGYAGDAGCSLAVAWGEDPDNATAGSPGLDVGTSVPPLRLVAGAKSLALKDDNDGDGQLSSGDVAIYHITVRNVGPTEIDAVYVYDNVPNNTTYVVSTTQAITSTSVGWFEIPDDPNGDHYPLDDVTDPKPDGVFISNDMQPGEIYTVTFDILLGEGDNFALIVNCETSFTEGGTVGACATTYVASRDWGDLPDTYGTSSATDGPRHTYTGLTLGTWYDYDSQGQPNEAATGDDATETTAPKDDDEDGVTIAGAATDWNLGNGTLSVVISGTGCLNAWMDFTDDVGTGAGLAYTDGNFTKASGGYDTRLTYSEHIIQNLKMNNGTTAVNVSIPPGLFAPVTNAYYFRFRLSPTDGEGNCTAAIAPTGLVLGGEIEDYRFNAGPTGVEILPAKVMGADSAIVLIWETASETDNLGFNVYRSTSRSGARVRLNAEMIPTLVPPGSPFGATYEYADTTARGGRTYYYWLEDVDIYGRTGQYGPVEGKLNNMRGKESPPNDPTAQLQP